MNNRIRNVFSLAAVCAGLTLSVTSSATEIKEVFPTVGGTMPDGWTFTAAAGESSATTASIVDIGGAHYLQFARGATGVASSAAVYYTGSAGEVVNGYLRDYTATMIVRSQHNRDGSSQGVVVGASSAISQAFSGYYISYSVNTKQLAIYSNPTGNAPASGTLLNSSVLPAGVVANTDYLLSVDVAGTLLTASLLSLDGSSVLASVNYTASSDIEGLFGFRASFGNSNVSASFADVTITTVIPEANTVFMILALIAALGATAVARRVRK